MFHDQDSPAMPLACRMNYHVWAYNSILPKEPYEHGRSIQSRHPMATIRHFFADGYWRVRQNLVP